MTSDGPVIAGDAPSVSAGVRRVEAVIARVLLWGGLLSMLVVAIGLALYAAGGGFDGQVLTHHRVVHPEREGRPPEVFVSIGEVVRGLSARPMNPLAVTALGLVLLLMTPVLGVVAAILACLAVGDRRYATIAAIVLSMLLVSLVLAGGAG